jgi:hypothetical protein
MCFLCCGLYDKVIFIKQPIQSIVRNAFDLGVLSAIRSTLTDLLARERALRVSTVVLSDNSLEALRLRNVPADQKRRVTVHNRSDTPVSIEKLSVLSRFPPQRHDWPTTLTATMTNTCLELTLKRRSLDVAASCHWHVCQKT